MVYLLSSILLLGPHYSMVGKTIGYDDFTRIRITRLAEAANLKPVFGSLDSQHLIRLGDFTVLCERETSHRLRALVQEDSDLRDSLVSLDFESWMPHRQPYLSLFSAVTIQRLKDYSALETKHRTKRDKELIDRVVRDLQEAKIGDEPLRFRRRHDTKLGPCYEVMYEIRGSLFTDGWARVQVWGGETSLSYAIDLPDAASLESP